MKRQVPQKQIPQGTLVYSTDPTTPPPPTTTSEPAPLPAKQQTARIWRDKKQRRGKTVTVIGGLVHDDETFEDLVRTLKKSCGAGGTFKVEEREIEIQGDHRESLKARFLEMGYKVKTVGG